MSQKWEMKEARVECKIFLSVFTVDTLHDCHLNLFSPKRLICKSRARHLHYFHLFCWGVTTPAKQASTLFHLDHWRGHRAMPRQWIMLSFHVQDWLKIRQVWISRVRFDGFTSQPIKHGPMSTQQLHWLKESCVIARSKVTCYFWGTKVTCDMITYLSL